MWHTMIHDFKIILHPMVPQKDYSRRSKRIIKKKNLGKKKEDADVDRSINWCKDLWRLHIDWSLGLWVDDTSEHSFIRSKSPSG